MGGWVVVREHLEPRGEGGGSPQALVEPHQLPGRGPCLLWPDCIETICHYVSKSRTRAPLIARWAFTRLCHLFKLLGAPDNVLPVT